MDDIRCAVVYWQMDDVKSILVASERLFGCGSDPSEMMRQTRIVTEVCFLFLCAMFEILQEITIAY